jgi:hypothetical protein
MRLLCLKQGLLSGQPSSLLVMFVDSKAVHSTEVLQKIVHVLIYSRPWACSDDNAVTAYNGWQALSYSLTMLTIGIPFLLATLTLPGACSQPFEQAPFHLSGTRHNSVQNILDPDFDRFVEQILDEWNSPGGLGVAVVQKNADETWSIETKGYGIAKGDGSKVTEDTYFSIGSNSKV